MSSIENGIYKPNTPNVTKHFQWITISNYPKCLREILYRYLSVKDTISKSSHKRRITHSNNLFSYLILLIKNFYYAIIGGFSTNDFFSYGYAFHNSNAKRTLKPYIGYYRRWEYRERLNSETESHILANKASTLLFLKKNNIPCSSVVLIYDGQYYSFQCEILRPTSHLSTDYFINNTYYVIKPLYSRWGKGVLKFFYSDCHFTNLNTYTFDNFFLYLRKLYSNQPFLIEQALINPSDLTFSWSNSFNTVRIITLRNNQGNIVPFSAALRIGTGESIIDNWSSGGLAANIDLSNGKIDKFFFKPALNLDYNNFKPHETRINKNCLTKYWKKAVNLSIESHKLFENMCTIGWDIGISTNGIVVIEGNEDWDIVLPQIVMNKGLLATKFSDLFYEAS